MLIFIIIIILDIIAVSMPGCHLGKPNPKRYQGDFLIFKVMASQ